MQWIHEDYVTYLFLRKQEDTFAALTGWWLCNSDQQTVVNGSGLSEGIEEFLWAFQALSSLTTEALDVTSWDKGGTN